MIRKSGILLTIIVLAFTLCTGMTGTVMAEAAAVFVFRQAVRANDHISALLSAAGAAGIGRFLTVKS